MKFTKFAILSVAFAGMLIGTQNTAKALIFFNTEIDINLSDLGIVGVVDVEDVLVLDFFGQVAINGDQDFPIGGSPALPGDPTVTRVVGAAENDGGIIGGISVPGGLSQTVLQTTAFEVTVVVNDWNGRVTSVSGLGTNDAEITLTYDNGVRTDAGGINAQPTGTGLIDLYVDTAENYDENNVATSADGTWIGTFAISQLQANTPGIEPYTDFGWDDTGVSVLNGGGTTRVGLVLIAAPTDTLWSTNGGASLLGVNIGLLTLIDSTDTTQPDDGPMIGISGGGDPVDVGADFDPATAVTGGGFPNGWPFDSVSRFDSNNTFAVVPEPSSIVMFGLGGALLGAAGLRRRRNAKKQAA